VKEFGLRITGKLIDEVVLNEVVKRKIGSLRDFRCWLVTK